MSSPEPNPITSATDQPPRISSDLGFLAGGGEMGALIRSLDWSRTPLGPPEDWSVALRTMVSFLLANRFPLLLWWGPEYTQIYNDAYRPILGTKHPRFLGRPVKECWSEIWDVIGPLIDTPYQGGPATWMDDIELEVNRHGYLEESHFTIAYSPVPDSAAPHGIGGVLATVHEITEKVISQRRVALLSELGARVPDAKTAEQACAVAGEILASYPKDVPFVIIYLLDGGSKQLRRVYDVRSPREPAAPALVPPEQGRLDVHDPWRLREVLCGEGSAVVEARGDSGPAVVLPIKSNHAHSPAAIAVLGLSPRIALDAQYHAFLDLLCTQIATGIANARAYEAERARAEALAEIDRAKTAFFANVSHEFRTPLALILGPLEEALGDTGLPPAARRQLDLVQRNSLRLLRLVNSLLEFSRIEAGRIRASYQATDLAALTRNLASMFHSLIERAGLSFEVDCEDLGEPLFVDREMWEKIVLNLISNAFKFTSHGHIRVRLRRDAGDGLLEISDSGIGIPAEEMPHLFERFHRVERTGGRTQEGSGIGLALVNELVKLHSGTIEAESIAGVGTTFRVRIKSGTSHLPPDQLVHSARASAPAAAALAFVQEARRWIAEETAPDAAPRAAAIGELREMSFDRRFEATFGARIVLADDNADMRDYIRDLLAPLYTIETVANGKQALDAIRARRPDLVISDVMMPELDGFALVSRLRSEETLRDVPVILLSARAGGEARIEGLDAGADDYLVKPFTARELTARVGAILERRRAQQAFRLRTAQVESLFNAAPFGICLVDADLKLIEVNPTARPAFGDIPNLIGRDLRQVMRILWPHHYADEIVARFRRTLETGEPHLVSEHAEERLDSGVKEYYEWQVHRIPTPDGRHGVVCYFREISAHVLARNRLEEADRQKNEFLAMLAHELRNPLAPIRNASEMLARILPGDRHAVALTGVLQRQVGVLIRLVDDLLDVSRITQGRIVLQLRSVRLAEIVAQAIETVEPLLKEKTHKISVISHQPLHVLADPTRLVQCVVNILTNAAKYTEPKGEICLESYELDGEAVLTITDNGAGIPAELLPHVFDLFVQSKRTLDRAQGGLGIGLSLVKRLIEMHGGRVSASSAGPGRGSRFEIRLPSSPAAEELEREAAVAAPPRKVLIVDDNTDAADSLAMLLKLEGHEVEVAYNPQDALALVSSFAPALVLLDIGLPDMDGYEVARRIRASPESARVRLVALTGYGQSEDKQHAHFAGFDAHLVKPVEFSELERFLAR
jgi:PAS domain S-box-containing protein